MNSNFRGKRLFAGRLFAGRLWGGVTTSAPPSVGLGGYAVPGHRRNLAARKRRLDTDDDVLLFLLQR